MTFRQTLKNLLGEYGPLTHQDIAEELGIAPTIARAKIGKLRATFKGEIRIAEWHRDEVDGRLYPRACYAVGSAPDKRRPPPLTRSQYNRRHKRSVRQQVNSVWALATPVGTRRRA